MQLDPEMIMQDSCGYRGTNTQVGHYFYLGVPSTLFQWLQHVRLLIQFPCPFFTLNPPVLLNSEILRKEQLHKEGQSLNF